MVSYMLQTINDHVNNWHNQF